MRVKEMTISNNLSVDDLITFIKTANSFESDISIKGANFTIDAKSILGVITLLMAGMDITIMARGEDEEEALKVISNLLTPFSAK
ncbi:HPr family phosphocarrier protein [Neobacillus muris]|uniref:HPr family phosphocarrier protein n=1 Tax=Neobacillus muris TaxID=2941334 RepID=UPI00203B53B7|nr:HPr family phosphocarrier protein [Neobacillus muris]